jgi:magnesium transporter
MLTCYKFTEDGFAEASEEEAEFLDLENPEPGEIQAIAEKLNIPTLFLTDPLDPRERPRMDQEDASVLIIVRVPENICPQGSEPPLEEYKRRALNTIPIGIILSKQKLVLVSGQSGVAKELFRRVNRKPRPRSMLSVVFKIFIESSSDFIRYLDSMEELIDQAEMTLGKVQGQSEEIMMLLTIDKTLINFTVALKSNRAIMEKLMSYPFLRLTPTETDLLEHALTENQQAIFMADIFGQVLGSVSDAFGTIMSNNLNKVVKFLTGITIILMLPTFIVGAYGMNVDLPLEKHPMAFWIIVLLCFASCALLWFFFTRKKWV